MKQLYYWALLFISTVFLGCNNNIITAPTVVTGSAEYYFVTASAICSGEVASDGGSKVTEKGICYVQGSQAPDITCDHVSGGQGNGYFMCTLSNITGSVWSYRAYAKNEAGIAYGDVKTFDCKNDYSEKETVAIGMVTPYNIKSTSMNTQVTLTWNIGVQLKEVGICYSKNTSPTISDNSFSLSNESISAFSYGENKSVPLLINDLSPSTTYYIRSYVVTNNDTYYSSEFSFTTEDLPQYTLNDYLGTYSFTYWNVYSQATRSYEWQIINISKSSNNWIVIEGLGGYDSADAYGKWDDKNRCIVIYGGKYNINKTNWNWSEGENNTYWSIFYPAYMEDKTINSYELVTDTFEDTDGDKAYGTATLVINKSGKLVYSSSDLVNNNGNAANALVWKIVYTNNYKTERYTNLETDLEFTKISSN